MDLTLTPSKPAATLPKPVVLCILDGVGIGAQDGGDAVHLAKTPTLDRLFSGPNATRLAAHGPAVGLPGPGDMGNSEVGHNALGAGRVFAQGAKLVNAAIADGSAFGETWEWLIQSGTLHLLGLLSDGNVHSHIDHLFAILARACADGVKRARVHILTDGRDVGSHTSLGFIRRLQEHLDGLNAQGVDYRIASGGGRMLLTMDRYEADWAMVQRGWDTHILGRGRQFATATEAVETLYAEDPKVNDQYLPGFVIAEDGEPVGALEEGDGMLFFNFRGDRALQISRACEAFCMGIGQVPIAERCAPDFRFAGMMEYDGDLHIPKRYLVAPPAIDRTVGEYLVANGKRSFAISETQKFGHVTFFFNGNRSGLLDAELEQYVEVPSDNVPFDQAPRMKAVEITDRVVEEVGSGRWDHIRLNIANGDMVGHTGELAATVEAMECVDACVARIEAAVLEAGGVLLVTADHGNADDMWMRNKDGSPKHDKSGATVPRTSHTLAPVPFALVDGSGQWVLDPPQDAGLANVSATLLELVGLEPPADYLPALVASADTPQ